MKTSHLSRRGVRLGGATTAVASLMACGQVQVDRFGGESPPSRDALVQLAASTDMPIYYLGEQFAGFHYDATGFTDGGREAEGEATLDPGHRVSFFYGEVCGDEYCVSRYEVQTKPVGPHPFKFVQECRRRPSVRGVPTVDFGPYDDGILLYSGDVEVHLWWEGDLSVVADALRQAGREQATTGALPMPPAAIVAAIDESCEPGPDFRRME